MLDVRQHALVVATLAGVSAAAVGWLVFGVSSIDRRLEPLRDTAARLEGHAPPARASGVQAAMAARSSPLFARPPSAGGPVLARLDGISVRPGGGSALISLAGGPARWMRQGETSGQTTLVSVMSGSVVVETPDGRSTLRLGETSAASPAASSAQGAVKMDEVPPGYRQPPPPASAPGM